MNNKGLLYLFEMKFEDANSWFNKVLEIEPNNLIATTNKQISKKLQGILTLKGVEEFGKELDLGIKVVKQPYIDTSEDVKLNLS